MPAANSSGATSLSWGPSGSTGGLMRLYAGDFTEHAVDLAVPGIGLDTVFARRYLSKDGFDSLIGRKWDYSYNMCVFRYQGSAPSSLVTILGNNRIVTFTRAAGQHIDGGAGLEDRLLYNAAPGWPCVLGLDTGDGESFIRWDDGAIWIFEDIITNYAPMFLENSRPKEIRDRNGNTIHITSEVATGNYTRVSQITDTLDRVYDFEYYPGAFGNLQSITEAGGQERQVEYAYYSAENNDIDDDNVPDGMPGDLARVTYLPGTDLERSVTYTYSVDDDPELAGLLLKIIDAKGHTVVENVYDENGRVVRQNFEDPELTRTYSYDDFDAGEVTPIDIGPASTTAIEPRHQTFAKDEQGFVTEYLFDGRNRLICQRQYLGIATPEETIGAGTLNLLEPGVRGGDPEAFHETRYAWNDQFNLTEMCDAGGTHTILGYEADIGTRPLKRGHVITTDVHNLAGGSPIHTANRYLPDNHASGLHLVEFSDVDDFDRQNTFTLTTHYQYDSKGNATAITYPPPTSASESFTYHANGLVLTHTSPKTINQSGAEAFPRTDQFNYAFNPNGSYDVTTVQDTGGKRITATDQYDEAGRLAASTDPKGNTSTFTYTLYDQLAFAAAPAPAAGASRPNTTYAYDENNNVVSISEANIDENGGVDTPVVTEYTYDLMDRVRRIVRDRSLLAAATAYDYYDSMRKVLVTTPEATAGLQPGNDMLYEYDERSLLFRTTRSGVESTTYNYNNRGSLAETLLPDGSTFRYEYDDYGRLAHTLDRVSTKTSIDLRNKRGLILEESVRGVANDLLSTTRTAYDEMGRVTNVQLNADTNGTTYVYTPAGELWKTIDPEGRTVITGYDSMHRPRVTTDEQGNTATYAYDENSNVIEMESHDYNEVPGGNGETTTTSFAYDNLDRQISMTDMANNTSHTRFDSLNRLRESIDAKENFCLYTYDNLGRQIGKAHFAAGADPTNTQPFAATSQGYDLNGRRVSQTDPKNYTTFYHFDHLDRQDQVRYADGSSVTVLEFDVMRRPRVVRNQDGSVATNDYDGEGRLAARTITGPSGVLATSETFTYDGLGRVLTAIVGGDESMTTSTSFDYRDTDSPPAVDKTITLGGLAPRTITTEYLHTGQPATKNLPSGRALGFGYNNAGRLNEVTTTANAPIATMNYVGSRRAQHTLGDNVVSVQYDYDPEQFGYRVQTMTQTKSAPPAQTLDQRTNTWDENYNRTGRDIYVGVDNEEGLHSYQYDALDRMGASTFASSTTNYTFDASGNRTSSGYTFSGSGKFLHQYSGSPQGALGYDAAGRLNALASTPANAYVYDALGRLKELYLGTGAALLNFEDDELPSPHVIDSGSWVAHLGYMEETSSGRGRIRWPMDSDMRRFSFRYWSGTDPENAANYDPEYYAQVIVRASENAITQEWNFVALVIQPDGIYLRQWINDAVTELGGVAVKIPEERWHEVTIELNGGHVSVRQSLDGLDEAQSIEASTDIPGAASQYVGFGVGERANFKFDNVGTDKPVTQGLKLHYDYDAYGHVVGRTLYDTGGAVESQQYFIYDNDRIAEELTVDENDQVDLAAEWVYGTYIDEPLVMYRGGQTYYYLHDDLYNVIALTDEQGNAVERYTYDDYGAPSFYDGAGNPISSTQIGNPFLFTGRRWDEVLNLYDYRTRYYDPKLGRFLRMDTIGPWGDRNNFGNPYTYVGNNPWSHTDPYGLATQEETVAAFRALYGAEGEHIADVFKAAGGSMQIQDRWFWQSSWSFDHDSKAITIDSSLDPVASAQAAFAALSQAFTYSDVNQYFLDSPDDLSRYSAARHSAVGESFRIAEQGAQFYISGIGVMNEGADWAIAIEDLSQGRRESILAMAPFISVFMLKGGRILIKEGDEVVDVIGQGAITDPARLLPAPKARSPFHHVFPQRPDLAKRFTDLGIDPNQFTMQIPKSLHDAIHSRGSRGGAWNRAWSNFFELYPDASAEDVYREAGRLIYEFQLPGGPVVPYPR